VAALVVIAKPAAAMVFLGAAIDDHRHGYLEDLKNYSTTPYKVIAILNLPERVPWSPLSRLRFVPSARVMRIHYH
jgi:hypothetical protein